MSEYIKPKVSPVPMQVIYILGTPYTIKEQSEKQNPKLKDADGICEQYSKEIVLADYLRNPTDVMTIENAEEYRKKVLRHEIIHAFLGESGLRCNSEWAENEEMVDWFAIQFEKIYRAFVEVGALEGQLDADKNARGRFLWGDLPSSEKPPTTYKVSGSCCCSPASTEVTQNE